MQTFNGIFTKEKIIKVGVIINGIENKKALQKADQMLTFRKYQH